MNDKIFTISKVSDFDKLRDKTLELNCKVAIFILKDIIFDKDYVFEPIDLYYSDVVVYGCGNGIYNLNINKDKKSFIGLFSNVNNIYVKDLKLSNVYVKGHQVCGGLVGNVNYNIYADGLEIDGNVDSYTICGTVCGACDNFVANNISINSSVNGKDVLGGLSGMADSYQVLGNSVVNSKISSYSNEDDLLIGDYIGYLNDKNKTLQLKKY